MNYEEIWERRSTTLQSLLALGDHSEVWHSIESAGACTAKRRLWQRWPIPFASITIASENRVAAGLVLNISAMQTIKGCGPSPDTQAAHSRRSFVVDLRDAEKDFRTVIQEV